MKNLRSSSFIFLILLSFLSLGNLYGETYQYKITCLGIRVVDINISNYFNKVNGILQVNADSHLITSIFPYVHNTYLTHYEDGFLPKTYEKHIDQKKYTENRICTYNRENKSAILYDRLKEENIKYQIMPESRDFFSALLYIANHLEQKDDIWLDANRLIWKASYEIEGRDVLKTSLGKLPAVRIKMRFHKVSTEPKENTDMLTNQLVNEDNTLYLWISDDERHLPLKAKYERKPFPVYWEILKFNS
jgi:hypothetical protein